MRDLVEQDGILSTIDDVAGLDEDGLAADPVIPEVDQAGHPEDADGMIEVSVKIANGHDPTREPVVVDLFGGPGGG